jgi:hypothetical protein
METVYILKEEIIMGIYLLIGLLVISLAVNNNEIAFDEGEKSLFGDLFWKVIAWPFWLFLRDK